MLAWVLIIALISACDLAPAGSEFKTISAETLIKNATFDRTEIVDVIEGSGKCEANLNEGDTNIPYIFFSKQGRGNLIIVKNQLGQEISRAKLSYNTFEKSWQSANIYLCRGKNVLEFTEDEVQQAVSSNQSGVTAGTFDFNNTVIRNIASGGWKEYQRYQGTGTNPPQIYRCEKYNLWWDFTVTSTNIVDGIYVIINDGPDAIKGNVYQAYPDKYQDLSGVTKYSIDVTGGGGYKEQLDSTTTLTPSIKYQVRVVYKNFSFATSPEYTYNLIADVDKNTTVWWKNASSSCYYDYLGVAPDGKTQYFLEIRKQDQYKTLKQVPSAEVSHDYLDGYWKKGGGYELKALPPLYADNSSTGFYWYPRTQKNIISYNPWKETQEYILFDPSRPTVIFVHGWSSVVDPGIYETFKYAQRLLDKGYNVGYYRWPQGTWQVAGHDAGSDITKVNSVVDAVWSPGQYGDVFKQALKDNLINGVAMNYYQETDGTRHYNPVSLSTYNGEVTLVGHSTGAQMVVLGMDDPEILAKRKMKIILAEPYFPGDIDTKTATVLGWSTEPDYHLERVESIMRKIDQYGHSMLWLSATFIGRQSFDNVNGSCAGSLYALVPLIDLNDAWPYTFIINTIGQANWDRLVQFHWDTTDYYTYPKKAQYANAISQLPSSLRQQLASKYCVTTAWHTSNAEIFHGYAIDWTFETMLNDHQCQLYYYDSRLWFCARPNYLPTGDSTIAYTRQFKNNKYKQYNNFLWYGAWVGGNTSFSVRDDDFYQY